MRTRNFLSALLFIALVGMGMLYYIRHKESFQMLTRVSVDAIVILALLRLTLIFCHGSQVKVVTDHYSLNLSFSQWFGLSRMTTFANLVLPFGSGSSLKAVYLQKFHNLAYSSFIASGAIAGITKLLITSLLTVTLLLCSGGGSAPSVPT